MTRILIVEDDINIARTIKATLSMVGYEGTVCHNGKTAVELIKSGGWDLILLDVMLPELSGFEIMTKIKGYNTPVIFLSAMQNVMDKVHGLRLGAEDYIVKPFEALELLARVEVVLRRTNKLSKTVTYGDIVADTSRHTVHKGGKRIALTPKEFDLLVFFLRNTDIAVTRERLVSAVWDINFDGESRTVDIHVQQIRKKLDLYKKLVTIPKLGYRLDSWDE